MTASALVSATPADSTGSSQSSGLRQVSSSAAMTTARVAYSSVLSIPLKALAESAALPGRPGDVHAQPASAGIGDLPDRVDEIGPRRASPCCPDRPRQCSDVLYPAAGRHRRDAERSGAPVHPLAHALIPQTRYVVSGQQSQTMRCIAFAGDVKLLLEKSCVNGVISSRSGSYARLVCACRPGSNVETRGGRARASEGSGQCCTF